MIWPDSSRIIGDDIIEIQLPKNPKELQQRQLPTVKQRQLLCNLLAHHTDFDLRWINEQAVALQDSEDIAERIFEIQPAQKPKKLQQSRLQY